MALVSWGRGLSVFSSDLCVVVGANRFLLVCCYGLDVLMCAVYFPCMVLVYSVCFLGISFFFLKKKSYESVRSWGCPFSEVDV